MGHLVQMAGLTVQNFVSAAVGHGRRRGPAPRLRPARGPAGSATSGPTWSAARVRVLLPIALGRGRPARRRRRRSRTSPPARRDHDARRRRQPIPGGPVASQEAIKELGTNGGGFFNANSAHPFENPTPCTNLLEIFLLLVIPFALARTFGRMVGDRRQGHAILGAMAVLWSVADRRCHDVGRDRRPRRRAQLAGGAMEGKETRFGDGPSALFAASTTGTSTGAVNSMHDSLHARRRWRADVQHDARRDRARRRRLRPVRHADAGHRRGLPRRADGRPDARVPRQEDRPARDRRSSRSTCWPRPALVLVGTGVAIGRCRRGPARMLNTGPHGFSEILYAFTSAANNNGVGVRRAHRRHAVLTTSPLGARDARSAGSCRSSSCWRLAGSLAQQAAAPATAGTLPTHTPAVRRPAGRRRPSSSSASPSSRRWPSGPSRRPCHDRPPSTRRPDATRRGRPEPLGRRALAQQLPTPPRSKLDPRHCGDPVMFVVGSAPSLTTVLARRRPERVRAGRSPSGCGSPCSSPTSPRPSPRAAARRRPPACAATHARRRPARPSARRHGTEERVPGAELQVGDLVVVEAGELIPGDGDVVEGVACVDESAITGSPPRSSASPAATARAVTGGTTVLSDRIVVRITTRAGRDLHRPDDRARRGRGAAEDPQRDRAERSCSPTLTIIFLLAVVTLQPMADYAGRRSSRWSCSSPCWSA